MTRTTWAEVPTTVRRALEEALGDQVEEAASQSGGFSSGSADRLVLRSGRRVFAKSVSRSRNAVTHELHRREAAVVRGLPASVSAPRVVATVEQDDWVVVAFEDVDGRHPGPDDTTVVLDALADLPRITDTSLLPRLPDELTPDSTSWVRLSEAGAKGGLDPWVTAHLDRLRDASAQLPGAAAGEHLVHLDCRADNLLLDASSRVWLADWPWASVGAPWFDSVTYLLDVLVRDPRSDVEGHLLHDSLREVPPEAVDAVLAGLAGSWTEALRTPAPADMPTLREFQRREAAAALGWLRRRWA
ncbi:aminoglycoside phosphotransferase family protein [Frigoribacterium sp. CFBP 8766]|uniref:phosphotransferase n=1 Tax=Frigoribacterium sp. CFBP 8766 TaxID=2775273 RepID=UPI001787614B|nr:phosphotransferase [Frigoribacterium sp. CFBP 8766]MBD8582938.1 aminoglycoside phosphotransferase family protein [Frigoribacterium sp. CFBP 8766]